MKKLLIVDDEEKMRNIFQRLFLSEGYTVFIASNATQTNELLKLEEIDLVLLDIKLPDVDGQMLYDVMKMFHPRVKVIVSSVYPIDEQMRLIYGADDYYDKSQSIEVLMHKVKEAISDGRAEEGAYS